MTTTDVSQDRTKKTPPPWTFDTALAYIGTRDAKTNTLKRASAFHHMIDVLKDGARTADHPRAIALLATAAKDSQISTVHKGRITGELPQAVSSQIYPT